jgi:hypothetical protein
MYRIDGALDLSRAHSRAATEASQAMNACVAAMLEASAAFAKTSAERNTALAATMISARSAESAAELHGAFMRDSMRAISILASRIADACAAAAKQCAELATQAMEVATTSAAPASKPH